jgi:hypothetical protein
MEISPGEEFSSIKFLGPFATSTVSPFEWGQTEAVTMTAQGNVLTRIHRVAESQVSRCILRHIQAGSAPGSQSISSLKYLLITSF